MEQYIPKSAVIAEIEKEIKRLYAGREYVGIPLDEENRVYGLQMAKDIINNLEVKEVDLENELKEDWLFADKTEVDCIESMCLTEDMFVSLAKKYFELGMAVSNKAQKGEEV